MRDRKHSVGIGNGFLRSLLLLAVWLCADSPTELPAQTFDKEKFFRARLAKGSQPPNAMAGNGVYEIVLEDFIGAGVGLYSVRTGPSHPITRSFSGRRQDLLAGAAQDQSGTSYTTIRSYNTQTDYVQTDLARSASEIRTVWLDSLFINEDSVATNYVEPIGTTGFRVIYRLPGYPRTDRRAAIRDTLLITQIINVHGFSFNNSWVEVTTKVQNTGTLPTRIGVRHLWDLNVARDDGPAVSQKSGDPFGPDEAALTQIDFPFCVAAANDTIDGTLPPAYEVYSSALTPANLKRAPFQPRRLQQVFWPLAYFHAFEYDSLKARNVTTGPITGGDVALQYYWGAAPQPAITLWPGEIFEATQALFAGLPNQTPTAIMDWTPPLCDLTAIHPGPPRTLEAMAQDLASGLSSIRVLESDNVEVHIPDFEAGTIAPVFVTASVIDQSRPGNFTLRLRDLCGRTLECDPIFLTLRPGLRVFSHRLEPILADRYFYLNNHGLTRLAVNLNGHAFMLSTDLPAPMADANWFAIPREGEIAIDIARYLKAEGNVMTLFFEGPPESYADLIVSDMVVKDKVDFALDLDPMPQQFTLRQNLPNPFHDQTQIRFDLPGASRLTHHVELKIYNVLGQAVRTLIAGELPANSYLVDWDGRDDFGREAGAGVYFYKLTTGNVQFTKKMARVR